MYTWKMEDGVALHALPYWLLRLDARIANQAVVRVALNELFGPDCVRIDCFIVRVGQRQLAIRCEGGIGNYVLLLLQDFFLFVVLGRR